MSAQPTLVRRVVLALLLAFGVIFALNLAAIYWQVTSLRIVDARLAGRAQSLLTALERAGSAAEAQAMAAAASAMLNQPAAPASMPGNPRAQRPAGALVLVAEVAAAPVAVRAADIEHDGHPMRVVRMASARWLVTIGEEKFNTASLLLKISGEMGIYLAGAFVLVLAATWLAVARGLDPLRRLSVTIAARGPDELQPLGVNPVYAELTPLTAAIDRLVAQLRGKMQAERGFVQDAAHELRTPLAVIAAQAHVLARTPGGARRAGAERDMDRAIERAARLIRQLLALAQVDSAPAGEAITLDVAQLVRQELALLAPAAMARGVELSMESPDVLMHALEVPALQSILHNLLANAVAYVGQGGQVLVTLAVRAGGLTVSVADDGPGIATEDQAEIFERFRRGRAQDAPGSGLGLAIVKQAAARLGGAVRLAAGIGGKGCAFVVELP